MTKGKIAFIGMREWINERGIRLLEFVDSDLKIDLHNDCYVESVKLNDRSELAFKFRGYPYKKLGQLLKDEWRFELVFHDASVLHVEPKGFLPFRGSHGMDDCFYMLDEQKNVAHLTWYGESDSPGQDPLVEFEAGAIEFRKLK